MSNRKLMASAGDAPTIHAPRIGTWTLALLLAAVHATAFADRFLTALLAAPLAHDLHLADTQLGLLQGTSFVASYMVATPLFGRLADRVSAKASILLGMAIWTAATLGFAFARSYGDLTAARLLLGVGEAGLTPAALALIAARAEPGQLGRAVSVFTSGATLGKGLSLFLGGVALALLTRLLVHGPAPWRALFALAVLPNLVLLATLAAVRAPAVVRSDRPALAEVMAQLRGSALAYVVLVAASGSVVLLSQTLAAWIPAFYARAFAISPAQAGMVAGAALLVCGPLGSLGGGALLDALGRRGVSDLPLKLLAGALAITALAATAAIATPKLVASIAAYAVVLLALGAAAPASLVQLQLLTPARLRGSTTALYIAVVTAIGFGVGPPVVGVMSDRMFGPGRHLAEALIAFVLCACAVGLLSLAVHFGRGAAVTGGERLRSDRAA
jgi:MFS family permease